jgi:hypothetical protein
MHPSLVETLSQIQWVAHRVNTLEGLGQVDSSWGVEVDLRSDVRSAGRIHLSHDPWSVGEDFAEWAQTFVRLGISGPIFLNTKEDGLEEQAIRTLRSAGLSEGHAVVFLDTTIPTLVKKSAHTRAWVHGCVRYSEFEPLEHALRFRNRATWAWVDCFGAQPVAPIAELQADLVSLRANFRVCWVSPELQGGSFEQIADFLPLLKPGDAVCTKRPQAWMEQASNSRSLNA